MKNLAENLEKSKILLIFAGGFPFLRGHAVFEMFWIDKRKRRYYTMKSLILAQDER